MDFAQSFRCIGDTILNPHLNELLRNQRVTKGVDAITINLLELVVMTAYVTQVILQDRPKRQILYC